jgi:imidazolonepropionase-like amidohydrolase
LCFLAWRAALAGPEVPGRPQREPIALVGATIHPVSGPAIPGGTLLFDKGIIVALGEDVDVPENARRIELPGKHVYPALFDAYTNVGLVEIEAVRATIDTAETGQINPNVRAQVAVNPDSEVIPVTRSNGVLLVTCAPEGGLISGRSAVLQLDGWTWEDLTLKADVGLHVRWPAMAPVSDWMEQRPARQQREERDQALSRIKQALDDARAYQRARQSAGTVQELDLRWEAMTPVLEQKVPLIVSADEVQQIQAAVAFAEREQLKLILHGGYDAPHCAELLKKHDVPVIVAGIYRLPRRQSEPYDTPFTLPERLRQAGIRFCISGNEGTSNVRNLPYHAAVAAAFGLPASEALKAVTLYPAEILGVADRVGSLEPGKDATLFVADGDPLETATHVEAAYVQGRPVELDDRHQRLWRKYQEKYRSRE